MQAYFAAALLLLVAARGQAPAPGPSTMRTAAKAHPGCWEMCKHAFGLGADSCMAECRTYTDGAEDGEDGLEDFVEDKTYNEAGGENMEEAFEKKYDREIPSCKPTFTSFPTFGDLDENGDGVITESEMISFGAKMCVSDEMALQVFMMADRDQNNVIDPKEWGQVGEDTAAEQAIDDSVDGNAASQADDEYNEVQMPPFKEFDANKDGVLDTKELQKVLEFELYRRFPESSYEQIESIAGGMAGDLEKIAGEMDKDGDGKISRAEFEGPPEKDEHLGGELVEASRGDKNGEDPDDLSRVEHPTMSPVPEDYLPSALFFAEPPRAHPRNGHRRAPTLRFRALARRAVLRPRARGLRLRRGA